MTLGKSQRGAWDFFPFPVLHAATYSDGLLANLPPQCERCTARPCRDVKVSPDFEPETCRYGVGFARIDDATTVVGFSVKGAEGATSKSRRFAKANPQTRLREQDVQRMVKRARESLGAALADFSRLQVLALERLSEDPELVAAVAQRLTQSISINVAASHDLGQLAAKVKSWTGSVLAEIDPNCEPEEVASRPENSKLGSAYHAATLMCERLDSLVFIEDPALASANPSKVAVYSLVLKYRRIYSSDLDAKNIDLRFAGESRGQTRINREAGGAVVQGLLDNLVKYAPPGSKATVQFEEDEQTIEVAFVSRGPRISPRERETIFMRGVRGEAAMSRESTGQGIGLATCRAICDEVGIELAVSQSPAAHARWSNNFETTFTLRFPKA